MQVLDFNVMNTQIIQKNVIQSKNVTFQNSSAVPLNEFRSVADINELIKSFGSRDSNQDALALKKIGF